MTRKGHRRGIHAPTKIRPGSRPGSIHIDPSARPTRVTAIAYGPEAVERFDDFPLERFEELRARFPVVWIDVVGLGTSEILESLSTHFGLHRLVLEDMVNLGQRAKVEPYDEHTFVVARMAPRSEDGAFEQLGLVIGKGWILTVQEEPGDCFEPVRERIRDAGGRLRHRTPDYLAYALLDAVIDGYFPYLGRVGDELRDLEDETLKRPTDETLERIRRKRTELLELRRMVWPHRDAIAMLVRDENELIADSTRIFLRDCQDHAIQVLELLDAYRELGADLMGVYMSSVSNRMNEVMKVLTVIATIFIPLGFIAGLYGMNFNGEVSPWNMPELQWAFGYPAVLAVMLLTVLGFVVFFKRKGWLG